MALREAGLASMAYFYFDFRDTDKQHLRNLLPSLLTQLSTRSENCCDVLSRIYKTHDDGARASLPQNASFSVTHFDEHGAPAAPRT
ncbi:hypothetical protein EDB85DRAFT_1921255 [Lactarius pseudohatsudake]|nr:hypothetical protein EDB85DRAFT_1921255 [Lactarius pseudohatsudake]